MKDRFGFSGDMYTIMCIAGVERSTKKEIYRNMLIKVQRRIAPRPRVCRAYRTAPTQAILVLTGTIILT